MLLALVYAGHLSALWTVPGLEGLERSSADLRFRIRGQEKPLDDRIVIVALDSKTRHKLPGMWQNRRGYAKLIAKVYESRPRAIGIDAFFTNPEVNLSEETIDAVRQALATLEKLETDSPASAIAKEALERVNTETYGDVSLGKAVQASQDRLVLALLFRLSGTALPYGSPESAGMSGARFDEYVDIEQPADRQAPQASGVYAPLPVIGESLVHMGHVNVKHDSDGAVREAPFVINHAGRYYQSLAMTMATMELQKPSSYAAGDDFASIGNTKVNLTSQGIGIISYLGGNKTFPHVSAYDVMTSDTPHPALKDKLVFIGYTDAARDKIITPFARQLDGIEVHATMLHNILHGQLIGQSSPWLGLLSLILMGLLIALLQLRGIRKRGAWAVGAGSAIAMVLFLAFAQYLFSHNGLLLQVVPTVLSAVVITLTAMTASLATEGREKAELRSAFGQYLQSTLVERILRNPADLRLGGQRRDLSVLFSDIRGFSSFSETLAPEVLSDFLNEYLTPMTDLVMAESGMLDKYIGDAVMAVFGAPIDLKDHANRACGTALAMIAALEPLNASWNKRQLPQIAIGIGINTGSMSVGNMGSEKRFDYTVMGDAVNLGARLEGLTKQYKVNILVGQATRDAAAESFVFREIDSVRVIGRSAAAKVYELCGTPSASPLSEDDLKLFGQGLAAYREMRWNEATEYFGQFLQTFPNDGPAKTLHARISLLRSQSLAVGWDGVFDQATK